MLLKTSKGKTYAADWIDTISSGGLFLQMPDARALSDIAAEFEGLAWLKREDANQGDKLFEGYGVLSLIQSVGGGIVMLKLEKGA